MGAAWIRLSFARVVPNISTITADKREIPSARKQEAPLGTVVFNRLWMGHSLARSFRMARIKNSVRKEDLNLWPLVLKVLFMITVETIADSTRVTIPKAEVPPDRLQPVLDWLRLEAMARKSRMTEETAQQMAEESKGDWWSKNQDRFNSFIP